jgi:hypothetical protein
MPVTRGGLAPAQIFRDDGAPPTINFMFNPESYTVTKTNNWEAGKRTGQSTTEAKFTSGAPIELSGLILWFDTYMDGPNPEPVTKYTNQLLKLMDVDTALSPPSPPPVKFKWGGLEFRSVMKSVAIEFTLFSKEGVPLRAKATVALQEMKPTPVASAPDPSRAWEDASLFITRSGGTKWDAKAMAQVTSADRLDWIAAQFSGSSDAWKAIAEANNIENPLNIKAGLSVVIPK